MADFTLVIGNKNYSSWSLRGWLMARIAGAAPKDDGFLFGSISAADAMYAPVVTRLRTYGVTVDSDTDAYCKAILAHPPMKEWIDAAKNEPWLIQAYEFQ